MRRGYSPRSARGILFIVDADKRLKAVAYGAASNPSPKIQSLVTGEISLL